MPQFKFTGFKHPDELASGRPLAVGDEVDLTDDEVKANSRLIEEGFLVEMNPSKETKKNRREESDK